MKITDITNEIRQKQEVLSKSIISFMAEYSMYGFAVVTDGNGGFETTLEFDKIMVKKWNLNGG